MKKNIVRKCCPGCGRDNTLNQKVFERDFSLAEEIVAFSRYNVYRCKECNLLYAGDIVVRAELDSYYDKMSKYETADFYLSKTLKKYYEYEVETFQPYLKKEDDILDIGCAFGGLLNAFKERGYNSVCGLEPSKKNCDYAMEEYGIKVYPGLLGDDLLRGKEFDFVPVKQCA